MICEKIEMSVDYKAMGCPEPKYTTYLTTYLLDNEPIEHTSWDLRPAIVICPGGGYHFTSPREAEPIALAYNAAGFHAFVLDYAISPVGWPAACCEAAKAVAYVRSIADEHHIDKNKILICGFSAGAHVAASLGVFYNLDIIKKYSGTDGVSDRPDGIILGYPVITDYNGKVHQGSKDKFLQNHPEAEELFSLENHITPDTPETFLWHTFNDGTVPVESSLRFAQKLRENDVPFEMHIFPDGSHGLSLANAVTGAENSTVEPWMGMSVRWVKDLK